MPSDFGTLTSVGSAGQCKKIGAGSPRVRRRFLGVIRGGRERAVQAAVGLLRTRMNQIRAFLLVTAMTFIPLVAAAQSNGELTQVGTWPVPSGMEVVTSLPTAGFGYLIVSAPPTLVIELDSTLAEVRSWSVPDDILPRSLTVGPDGRLSAIRLTSGAIVEYGGGGGDPKPSYPIDGEDLFDALAAGEGRWILLARTRENELVLFDTRSGERLADLSGYLSPDPDERWMGLLTLMGGVVLVSERFAPFRTVGIPLGDEPQSSARWPPIVIEGHAAATEGEAWQAMPVVGVQGGFLQTISNVGSDDRWFVLFDSHGKRLSERMIRVPIALSAAHPSRNVVLAARRHSTVELVQYRWRWNDNVRPHNTLEVVR